MSFKSVSLRLSREEDVETIENVETDQDVSDVIAASDEVEECNELNAKIEETVTTLEEADEVVDELEEQVELSDDLIENNPEAINQDTVIAAQESFAIALGKLGHDFDSMNVSRISVESATSDPVSALRLCNEGIKSALSSTVDVIKAIVANVQKWIKEYYTKVVLLTGNNEKQARQLYSKYKNFGQNDISNEAAKEAYNRIYTIAKLQDNKLDVKAINDFFTRNYKNLTTVLLSKTELPKLDEELVNITTRAPLDKNFVEIVEKADYSPKGRIVPFAINKSGLTVLDITSNDGKFGYEVASISISPEQSVAISNFKKVSDVLAEINNLVKMFAGVKEFYKLIEKKTSEVGAAFDKGSNNINPDDKEAAAALKIEERKAKLILTVCGPRSLANYVSTAKAMLSACAIALKDVK